MDFSVNFMQRTSAVLTEAFQLKKYKAMPVALAVLVGIFMLPLVLAGLVCAGMLYALGYLFSIVSLPVQSLHKLLREEGQNVAHATQFIIYFLSWTFVFSCYALLTFFMIYLTVLYTVFSLLTYLWTLGGFKFHAFAKEEDISVEVTGKYANALPAIFLVIMAVLLIVLPLYETVSTIVEFELDMKFDDFVDLFEYQVNAYTGWRILAAALYSAFVFAPNPKKKIGE